MIKKSPLIPLFQRGANQRILTAVFLLSALPVLAVVMFPSQFDRVIPAESYVVFHNIAEFFSIMVSFSIFGIGWYTYERSGNRHALFLSTAFLSIGLLDFMHTMSNAAMPAFITANSSNKSTQFWIAARLFQAAAFLASAYIYPERPIRWLSKKVLMVSAILLTGLVVTGTVFFPEYAPVTHIQGTGLTPFKKISEYLVVVGLCISAAVYRRRMKKTGDRAVIYYLAAFIISIFSEIIFASYTKVFDTYNVLGHVYKIAAFYMMYKGVFIASVNEPYMKLADMTVSRDELSKEMEERTRAEEALRESEQRYHSLFENMVEGCAYCRMLFDDLGRPADFVYLDVNSAFGRLTGLENVVGKKVTEAIPGIKESHPELFEIYGRVALTGRPEKFEIQFAPLDICLSLSVYSMEKGHFVAVFDNITERKCAEREREANIEQLKSLADNLERYNRELEQFAYIASHDLREPLRMVSSFLQLIGQRYKHKLDKDADDFIGFAVSGAEYMQMLLRDLRSYSRIGRGEEPFILTDLNVALKRASDNMNTAIEENRVEIINEILPSVHSDEVQMVQLFQNLIENAIKFHSNEPPRIRISAEHKGAEWVIQVSDNGIGIAPEYFDRIFLMFKRLHTRDKYPGTGAGLAICKKIVERHGGRIWGESEKGKGATFCFTIPDKRQSQGARVMGKGTVAV
ncbi:MAG: hypothetical protein C4560_00970 [Nitrospiraceae bacterium]|nr:MAG: hypothetical protein C4560_00970 [Nitrospiraceae bacterium]